MVFNTSSERLVQYVVKGRNSISQS